MSCAVAAETQADWCMAWRQGGAYRGLSRQKRAARLHAAWGQPALLLEIPDFCFWLRNERCCHGPDSSCSKSLRRATFEAKLGKASRLRLVHNGIGEEEFAPVLPCAEPSDLVFVGELRTLKGSTR